MNLFDIAVAKKLAGGGGGGGGGDSDFSTAEVEIRDQGVGGYTLFLPIVSEAFGPFPDMIDATRPIDAGNYIVPLYKGELDVAIELEEGMSVNTSGFAEYDGGIIIITGDCTITIS